MSNLAEVIPAMPTQAPATPALSNNGIFQFGNFIEAMNAADLLARSAIVPDLYRYVDSNGNHNQNANANCLLALNMAQRMGYDPLMIMQNLYVIKGRPAWSSQFVTAAINGCGRFTTLNYEEKDLGKKEVKYYNDIVKIDDMSCVAWAIDKSTGERVESIAITIEMAVKEGWYTKKDSKWKTMAKQMLRYRAAAFFGRSYVPDILMGIYPKDEVEDFLDVTPVQQPVAQTQQKLPCYDIKPLLQEIEAMQTLDQCTAIGGKLKALVNDPSVNFCNDDYQTLRNSWKFRRDAIDASFQETSPETAPIATEQPVDTSAAPPSDIAEPPSDIDADKKKLIESDLIKSISAATLQDADKIRAVLYSAKAVIGDAKFDKFDAMLDAKLNDLADSTTAE